MQSRAHLPVDRVGRGYDGAPRIERSVNTGLGDGDGLLLHDFVDRHAIDVGHLVELVDAHDSSIGEDHGTGFESALT